MMSQMQFHQKQPRAPKKRNNAAAGGAIALIILGVVLWILSSLGTIQGPWTNIFGPIFTGAGLIVGLLPLIPIHPDIADPTSTPPASSQRRQQNHPLVSTGILPRLEPDEGAIVVYTKGFLRGSNLALCSGFVSSDTKPEMAVCVNKRKIHGRVCYVAVFSPLKPGNYTIYSESRGQIARMTVYAGQVAEIDWQ